MVDTALSPIAFETHPQRYRHWILQVDGGTAHLILRVERFGGLDASIEMKGNSYDLSVDIELHDAVQRLRFEHPNVRTVVITSAEDRIFCSGANIHYLARSSHSHKVNFCKFTNETRLYIEEASAESGQRYIAACNGFAAGGGYELALACDEILLVDDGSSAVSLPEVALLGVLPGTGGLTRLIDKRAVRPDLADLFVTKAEGIRGARAVEWGLVDEVIPRSRFAQDVAKRADALGRAAAGGATPGSGISLDALMPEFRDDSLIYAHVHVAIDPARRTANVTVEGPDGTQPQDASQARAEGAAWWPLRMARELDDAVLQLRFNHPEIGLLLLRTSGDPDAAFACGEMLAASEDWFVRETRLLLGRVFRRLELTARSLFAIVESGSCFAGPLFELLTLADRVYMLDAEGVSVRPGTLSDGRLRRWNGLSRLEARFLRQPEVISQIIDAGRSGPIPASDAEALGLVSDLIDDIDFDDTVRLGVEERASLSPDALTGMEASLRAAGPETMATRIFSRLSAWQNWIFSRPNATGECGALSLYGRPERPQFDFTRT